MAEKNKVFPNRLKTARVNARYTVQGLANKLGLCYSTIANYECGLREPNLDVLLEIAKICGCSTDYLVGKVDVLTDDMELKTVCDFIGFNEKTVLALHEDVVRLKNNKNTKTFIYSSFDDKE